MTCPHCSAAIAPGDVFCEQCGETLDETAAAAAAATVDAAVAPCPQCGSASFDDGFCASCGAKQATWRDHYAESPAAWLAGVCDRGVLHQRNEDALALGATADRAVLVVCDGVTSAPDSDQASLAAARTARDVLASAAAPAPGTAAAVSHWTTELIGACAAANAQAVAVAHCLGNPRDPPSCTFVAAVAEASLVSAAWCGDSRAYWLGDDGDTRSLTVDHSLGTEMIAAGRSRGDAEADPAFHTITRWLGADSANATPETATMEVTGAGWLVVCSDGLWNYASGPAEMDALVRAVPSTEPMVIADALVAVANGRGGHDNITVAVARLGEGTP